MSAAVQWQEAQRQIIDRIDIMAEYQQLGVEITSSTPNGNGWVVCRAFGKEDRDPSAGINVTGEHPTKGHYKEFSGDGRYLSFFDFAAMANPSLRDWKEARNHYARQVGVVLPNGEKKSSSPGDQIAEQAWNDALANSYCDLRKPGITPEALKMVGARMGAWPASSKQHKVFALPIYGPDSTDDPSGWVMLPRNNGKLPIFDSKGKCTGHTKVKTIYGSKSGWLNEHALRHLDGAEIIWKVEGVTDMLTLLSIIPAELRDKHLVVTNSGGCRQFPSVDMVAALKDKTVYTVGDLDKPGQEGARRWAEAAATVTTESRLVRLPGKVQESHGRDLRDAILDGLTYRDLLEQAADAEKAEPATPEAQGESVMASVTSGSNPPLTDTGNAERFARQHQHKVRYCSPWRKWVYFND